MRIPRWTLILSAGAMAVALATLAANLVLIKAESKAGSPVPGESLSATPSPPSSAEAAARVLDPALDLEERIVALKTLAQAAPDAGPILVLLRRLKASSPDELQVRALAITALGRFPQDPAAREVLVVLAFTRSAERSERALALDVLARRPDVAECRKPLTTLATDPEPLVAAQAKRILATLPSDSPR